MILQQYEEVIRNNFHQNSAVFVKNTNTSVSSMKIQLKVIFGKNFEVNLNLNPENEDFMMSPEKSCKRLQMLLEHNIKKFEQNELYFEALQRKNEIINITKEFSVQKIYELGDAIISYEEQDKELTIKIDEKTKELVKTIYHRYHD